jgi:undecaprenyl-diphosphatase
MNWLDASVLHFLNSFAQRSDIADQFLWSISHNVLVSGGFVFTLFWYLWFQNQTANGEKHEFLLFGLIATVGCLIFARVLAFSFPFRVRPLHDPSLHFRMPYGGDPSALWGWSSFPSDHAAVFFCLATALMFVSRPLGILAFCDALFVVSLPRIYCGIHYPTDVIVGGLLGIGFASLAHFTLVRQAATRSLLRLKEKRPDVFYAGLFLCTFEVAELFNGLRHVVERGLRVAKLL